ncbi:MAG: hypothetical protein ACOC7Y_02170 [Chloroflexota bacterium]
MVHLTQHVLEVGAIELRGNLGLGELSVEACQRRAERGDHGPGLLSWRVGWALRGLVSLSRLRRADFAYEAEEVAQQRFKSSSLVSILR